MRFFHKKKKKKPTTLALDERLEHGPFFPEPLDTKQAVWFYCTVAQWLRAACPQLKEEAWEAIAATLEAEHGVTGVGHLTKTRSGAFHDAGVPRHVASKLAEEINKMLPLTRGTLAPTRLCAGAIGGRLARVEATWSSREILQLRLDWRVVERGSGSSVRTLRRASRRFPDDDFFGDVRDGALELAESEHVTSARAEFVVMPGMRRTFSSTKTSPAYRLVNVRLRTSQGRSAVLGLDCGTGQLASADRDSHLGRRGKVLVADLSPPDGRALLGFEAAASQAAKIGRLRPIFARVADVDDGLEASAVESSAPRRSDVDVRASARFDVAAARARQAGARNPYTGALLADLAPPTQHLRAEPTPPSRTSDPFLAEPRPSEVCAAAAIPRPSEVRAAVAVALSCDSTLPVAPLVAAAAPRPSAPPVAAAAAPRATALVWNPSPRGGAAAAWTTPGDASRAASGAPPGGAAPSDLAAATREIERLRAELAAARRGPAAPAAAAVAYPAPSASTAQPLAYPASPRFSAVARPVASVLAVDGELVAWPEAPRAAPVVAAQGAGRGRVARAASAVVRGGVGAARGAARVLAPDAIVGGGVAAVGAAADLLM